MKASEINEINDWLLCLPASWGPIVKPALEKIIEAGAVITEVKYKFGMLRIYVDYHKANSEYVDQIISNAEWYIEQLEHTSRHVS